MRGWLIRKGDGAALCLMGTGLVAVLAGQAAQGDTARWIGSTAGLALLAGGFGIAAAVPYASGVVRFGRDLATQKRYVREHERVRFHLAAAAYVSLAVLTGGLAGASATSGPFTP